MEKDAPFCCCCWGRTSGEDPGEEEREGLLNLSGDSTSPTPPTVFFLGVVVAPSLSAASAAAATAGEAGGSPCATAPATKEGDLNFFGVKDRKEDSSSIETDVEGRRAWRCCGDVVLVAAEG